MAIVCYFEGIDRLESLCNHIKAIDHSSSHKLVVMHLLHELRRPPPECTKELFSEEKEERYARLADTNSTKSADYARGLHRRSGVDRHVGSGAVLRSSFEVRGEFDR